MLRARRAEGGAWPFVVSVLFSVAAAAATQTASFFLYTHMLRLTVEGRRRCDMREDLHETHLKSLNAFKGCISSEGLHWYSLQLGL